MIDKTDTVKTGTGVSMRATWIEIDHSALSGNTRFIKAQLADATRLMAVIKANAYGHDAGIVAQIVAKAGADWLAVATVGEGLELRGQGIGLPILILGYTPLGGIPVAIQAGLTLTVENVESLQQVAHAAHQLGVTACIHVKVNTGMNRLGLIPSAVAPFLAMAAEQPGLCVEGLFTHFATADEPDNPFVQEQHSIFQVLIGELTEIGLRPPLVHAANSAATLYQPQTHFDLIRFGIALYGLPPDLESAPLPPALKPVLSWKAQVVHVTPLRAGEGVGYGQAFVASQAMTVATIPVGYADGFPRSPQNWQTVLLHGEEVPLVGRVCMDQSMIDVSALLAKGQMVAVGDEVVLIGQQGTQILTAEEIGRRTGTINYEVVSRIMPRVPRIVVWPA